MRTIGLRGIFLYIMLLRAIGLIFWQGNYCVREGWLCLLLRLLSLLAIRLFGSSIEARKHILKS